MPIFKLDKQNLIAVFEKRFDLEKDIQSLTEKNLESIFGLKFIATEFNIQGLRIDTLAFDEEARSFVIIEYKKDRNISIIDQGYAYLGLISNNKADFILYYNETQKNNIKRDQVDWTQTKVVFVAHSYTAHQRLAISFNDMPIELWEVRKYEDGLLSFDQLKTPETNESIKTFSKTGGIVEKISREVKQYTINGHFKSDWRESKKMFDILREKILELDNRIEESPQKYYIGYKIGSKVLVGLIIQKSKIILNLPRVKPSDLNDPEKKTKYQKNSFKYYNKHITDYLINDLNNIDYSIFLIKQVYDKFYK